mmetsp:Transcript_54920/g.64212  ORF Transcript_54920/g.64212 Transcript_54920/m.64212 type:complete len:177 (+) Transcript_54920:85-615(+)
MTNYHILLLVNNSVNLFMHQHEEKTYLKMMILVLFQYRMTFTMHSASSSGQLGYWHSSACLEYTLSITERRNVSSGVLLVHGLSGKLLANHVSDDTQHSSTAVVKLNIQFAGLLFGVLDVFTEPSYTVISIVLGGRKPRKLNKTEEKKDLGKSSGGNSEDSINSGGDVRKLKVVGR